MVTSFTVRGVRCRGRAVSNRKLITIWRGLTCKPFPRVVAFQLEDPDFDRLLELRSCRENERREMLEWGRVLSAGGTDGCVFNVDEYADVDYVILVRKNPYHEFDEILMHELTHIARGDL